MLGWPLVIPPHAEVISSIGDALSLLRAERERTVDAADAATIEAMMDDVEAEVVAAGASPASVEVRFEEVPERSTVRAVATGAVGLQSGALPGRERVRRVDGAPCARDRGATVEQHGRFWVVDDAKRIRVLDRYGDEVIDVEGVRTDGEHVGDVFDRAHQVPRPGDAAPDGVDRRRSSARRAQLVRPGGRSLRRAHRRRLPRRPGSLMALYVSARKRRTRAVIVAVVVGLLAFGLGLLVGRQQVPSVGERISAVQDDADEVATGLERLDVEYAKVLAGTDSLDQAVLTPIDQTVTRAQQAHSTTPRGSSPRSAPRCSTRSPRPVSPPSPTIRRTCSSRTCRRRRRSCARRSASTSDPARRAARSPAAPCAGVGRCTLSSADEA